MAMNVQLTGHTFYLLLFLLYGYEQAIDWSHLLPPPPPLIWLCTRTLSIRQPILTVHLECIYIIIYNITYALYKHTHNIAPYSTALAEAICCISVCAH